MFSEKVSLVRPFTAMEIFEKSQKMERAGKSVIHFELGEPDFNTPSVVVDAAIAALKDGYTHYSSSLGDADLREAIAKKYSQRYGVDVDADRIICFPGTSSAMFLLFSALLNAGDEVIISDPYYSCYPSFISYSGGVPVCVPTLEEDGFRLDPQMVSQKINSKTKAMLINSPANPTGVVMEASRLQALADLGVFIISDEIYHGLSYGEEAEHSILEFTQNALVIGGFSKAYAMTGWRLGYLILPKEMVRPLQILIQNFFICAPTMVQRAALAALDSADADVAAMCAKYNSRRKKLLNGLRRLGFGIKVEPMGAFYILANARHLNPDSQALCFEILEKAGVGVSPGVDFGSQAEGFLRFSYATSEENIEEGLRRLETYIASRP